MKTYLLRDTPVGVLLITLSLFGLYGAWKAANMPSIDDMIVIILAVIATTKLITAGIKLIIGVQIEMD